MMSFFAGILLATLGTLYDDDPYGLREVFFYGQVRLLMFLPPIAAIGLLTWFSISKSRRHPTSGIAITLMIMAAGMTWCIAVWSAMLFTSTLILIRYHYRFTKKYPIIDFALIWIVVVLFSGLWLESEPNRNTYNDTMTITYSINSKEPNFADEW